MSNLSWFSLSIVCPGCTTGTAFWSFRLYGTSIGLQVTSCLSPDPMLSQSSMVKTLLQRNRKNRNHRRGQKGVQRNSYRSMLLVGWCDFSNEWIELMQSVETAAFSENCILGK